MQIAGNECWTCHQRIGTMRSGAGCERCQVVVHQVCAPSGNCPKCGQSFLPVDEVHARPSAADQVVLDRPTSVTVLGRLALVGAFLASLRAVAGIGILTSDGTEGISRIFEGVVMAGLSAGFGLGLLAGHRWARQFYLWGTPFILIVNFTLSDPNSTPPIQAWLFILQAGLYLMWAFFLTRPKATEFFRRNRVASASAS